MLERYDILLRLTLLRRFQSPKHLIFWNVTPGQMIVSAWNGHQHNTENSRMNAAA